MNGQHTLAGLLASPAVLTAPDGSTLELGRGGFAMLYAAVCDGRLLLPAADNPAPEQMSVELEPHTELEQVVVVHGVLRYTVEPEPGAWASSAVRLCLVPRCMEEPAGSRTLTAVCAQHMGLPLAGADGDERISRWDAYTRRLEVLREELLACQQDCLTLKEFTQTLADVSPDVRTLTDGEFMKLLALKLEDLDLSEGWDNVDASRRLVVTVGQEAWVQVRRDYWGTVEVKESPDAAGSLAGEVYARGLMTVAEAEEAVRARVRAS